MPQVDAYDTLHLLSIVAHQRANKAEMGIAYQYSYFQSALAERLAKVLSPTQILQLYDIIAEDFSIELSE